MANSDYISSGASVAFAPIAQLSVALGYHDHTLPYEFPNFPNGDALTVGMVAMCDDEIMQITDVGIDEVTVKRGCADTVPALHDYGAEVWFFDLGMVGTDAIEKSAGETNGVKYSPFAAGGEGLPPELSGVDGVTYNWRYFRPYPPGQMRVDGARWWVGGNVIAADDPVMVLTWANRDRVLQADQLLDHDDPSVGPEPGTTYTVRVHHWLTDAVIRTESGIAADVASWNYTWGQAMLDLGFTGALESGDLAFGKLSVFATRQGFDSWQGYRIDFAISTLGHFIRVAQMAEVSAQPDNPEDEVGYPAPLPGPGMYAGQFAMQTAQAPSPEQSGGPGADIGPGMYVAQLAEGAGQQTSFYTPMNRNLFESPYAWLARRGDNPLAHKLVTVVARPNDRLTDTHAIWSRYDWPAGAGAVLPYIDVVDPALFTPWITLGADTSYLDITLQVGGSSFYDGVPLDGVQVGQVAQIGAEIVRIVSISEGSIAVARGCFDTIPAWHGAGSRLWFFEAQSGNDLTPYVQKMADGVMGAAVQVKMVPGVFGTPLPLTAVPTDYITMKQRTERPYPPGQVTVNGARWYLGGMPTVGQSLFIRWVHRNRVAQGVGAVDHLAVGTYPEGGQTYRLAITVSANGIEAPIREAFVNGVEFEYTWAMAYLDGYRVGNMLKACGRVTVGMTLEAVRGGLKSWQSYVIPLLLPSYTCPPGQAAGGGGIGTPPNNGNGDLGDFYNPGSGPTDPVHGNPGDNGNGPPPAPDLPPDWPDPLGTGGGGGGTGGGDPNPELGEHWDRNWDRHWDAYTDDDMGS